ncbi:hypothetical protein [Marivirga lumbricoides]
MKTLKTLKYALLVVAIFSFSACELVEEPDFDTETGSSQPQHSDID